MDDVAALTRAGRQTGGVTAKGQACGRWLALLTGAGRQAEVGAAIARRLAADGWRAVARGNVARNGRRKWAGQPAGFDHGQVQARDLRLCSRGEVPRLLDG